MLTLYRLVKEQPLTSMDKDNAVLIIQLYHIMKMT